MNKIFKVVSLLSVAFIVLFFTNRYDFFRNYNFNYKSHYNVHALEDGWVVGSILKSRQDGLFSTNTFTTRFFTQESIVNRDNIHTMLQYQKDIMVTTLPMIKKGNWSTYHSALRLPITFWVLLDNAHFNITGKYENTIFLARTICDFFTVIVLIAFLIWGFYEFGLIFSILSFFFFIFFPHTNSSYLHSPPFFDLLPLISLLLVYYYKKFRFLFFINFFLVALSQSNQYERTTIVFAISFLPLLYYSIKDKWDKRQILKHILILASSGVLAIMTILVIHFQSLADDLGGTENAKNWFVAKFIQRSYSELAESEIGETLKLYEAFDNIEKSEIVNKVERTTLGTESTLQFVLKRFFVDNTIFLRLNALSYLVLNFILFLISIFWYKKKKLIIFKKLLAMNCITLTTMLSIFAYFIIFKSQAAEPLHDFPIHFFSYPYLFLLFPTIILFVFSLFSYTKNQKIKTLLQLNV